MNICVLGRQPELGLAELERLYGAEQVRPAGDTCAAVDARVDFERLGGSVKLASVIATVTGDIRKAFKQLRSDLPRLVQGLPEGKIKLGLSLYGFTMRSYDINGEGLQIKRSLKKQGRSVRLVPNTEPALSSAQTYHNSLTTELGLEFIFVKDGDKTIIGRVTAVQNIDAYRIRDRERPKRDAFVGMLPPKLAQIIVNLAVGDASESTKYTVLDPFCGTGVVLQEALLMGYSVYGTDLSAKMVDYTKANLAWLEARGTKFESRVEVADATSFSWDFSNIQHPASNICIATETYLGQPLGGQHPTKEKFLEIVHDTNRIVRDFLKNISAQLPSGSSLCLAVPAWFIDGNTTHLPLVEELDSLGLTCHTFSHVVAPLIYRREDQVTGRELLVLTKE